MPKPCCTPIFNLIAVQLEPEGKPCFVCVNIDFVIADHYPSRPYVFKKSSYRDPSLSHSHAYITHPSPKIVVRRLESLPRRTMRKLTEVELEKLQSLLDLEAKKLCELEGDVCIFELIESYARPFLDDRNVEER